MVQLMIDFYVLEAKVKEVRVGRDSANALYHQLEPLIYKKHQVDSTLYKQSMDYYLGEPETMEALYAAIVDSLSLQERLVNEKEKKQKQELKKVDRKK